MNKNRVVVKTKYYIVSVYLIILLLSLSAACLVVLSSNMTIGQTVDKVYGWGKFVQGMREFNRGEYDEAEKSLKIASEKEYYKANLKLGDISYQKYIDGMGIEDLLEAIRDYKIAAINNIAGANIRLDKIYRSVNANESIMLDAINWYEFQYTVGKISKDGSLRKINVIRRELGLFYYDGGEKLIKKCSADAVAFYKKASENECYAAEIKLGELYYTGDILTRDYHQARYWFEEASMHNIPRAQYYLSEIYRNGCGVDVDHAKATQYLEEAAENNDPLALINLALLYNNGIHITQDSAKAKKYIKSGIAALNADASNKSDIAAISVYYAIMLSISKDVDEFNNTASLLKSTAIKSDGEESAIQYLSAAATEGYPRAQLFLGQYLINHKGEYRRGFNWVKQSAENNYPSAMLALSSLYREGTGIGKDNLKWGEWFAKAVSHKEAAAECVMGMLYYDPEIFPELSNALSIEKDYCKSLALIRQSVKQGDPNAQFFLGLLYKDGEVIAKDDKKFFELALLAAEQGLPEAQNAISLAYEDGVGTDKNPAEAVKWLAKAVEQDGKYEYKTIGGRLYYELLPVVSEALGLVVEGYDEAEKSVDSAVKWVKELF